MKRFLRIIQWATLIVAVAGATLLFGFAVEQQLSHGLRDGPASHTGYDWLAALVFVGLPASGCLLLGWATTLVLHLRFGEKALGRMAWATALIASMGAGLAAFELVLGEIANHTRARFAEQYAAMDRIAGDHDALATYATSHDINQPMIAGAVTPLRAAIVHHFPDLVAAFIARGAVPDDDDLTAAVRGGDVATARLLFANGPHFSGLEALAAAFEAGNTEQIALLVAQHVDVAGALVHLIDPVKLSLYRGEVDYRALVQRLRQDAASVIASELHSWESSSGGVPGREDDVVGLLNRLLASEHLCEDSALVRPLHEEWMKETRLCTCYYCPYARQINWAILAARYPGTLPALEQSTHVAMLRTLARSVVESKADQKLIVRQAAANRNVFLLELLEEAGFNVRLLDGEMTEGPSESLSEWQRMRSHLQQKGVRFAADPDTANEGEGEADDESAR